MTLATKCICLVFIIAFRAEPEKPHRIGTAESIGAELAAQYPTPISISRDGSRILLKTSKWNVENLSVVERRSGKILGETESPNAHLAISWSPTGGEIAYLSADGNGDNFHPFLWNFNEQTRPLDAPTTNTAIQPMRWSPDGQRIAYLVGNNEQGSLWMLNAHGTIQAHRMIDNVQTLSDFEWSPDGHFIASIIRNVPLALRVLSTKTGDVVARVPLGTTQISEVRDLSWSHSGKELALSVRRHSDFFELIQVNPWSQATTLCASGAGDILTPHFTPGDQQIIYSMSVDSQMSLYKTSCISLKSAKIWSRGGTVRFLKFLENSNKPSSGDGSFFALHTGLQEPPALYRVFLDARKPEIVYVSPNSFRLKSSPAEMVNVSSTDGTPIPTVVWRSKIPSSNTVLVDVHGGPRLQQYRRWEALPELLTQVGVDVLSPNYRGSGGYGLRFEYATAGTQIDDIVAVCKYAKSLHGKKTRVIVMGTSYGAFLAASAAIADYKDLDGVVLVSIIARRGLPTSAGAWKLPLVCFHGANDPLAPDKAKSLLESLFGPHVFELKGNEWHMLEGEGHVFRLTRSWSAVYQSVSDLILSSPRLD